MKYYSTCSARPIRVFVLAVAGLAISHAAACGGSDHDGIDSNEGARRAYLGLDKSINKALKLGFDGFNAASSANIPSQSATGDAKGTLVVSGQVDQGSSNNKGMRLLLGMTGYSDGEFVVDQDDDKIEVLYDTATDLAMQPSLNLKLQGVPGGTFTGDLVGPFTMDGDMDGSVTLNLKVAGQLEDAGGGVVRRKAGTTTVTGTAQSGNGTYNVNISI